jgi:putative membrane protein
MAKTKLHPGAKWLFRLATYFITLVPVIFIVSFLGGLIGIFNLGAILLLGITIIVITILIGEFYASLAYNRFFYEFTGSELKIEKGVIWKKYSNIPYERVQNVDVTRGIIARLCGFSTVNIQTAGYGGYYGRRGFGMHSEGYLPAVSIKDAEKIREFVMKKISGKKKSSGGL